MVRKAVRTYTQIEHDFKKADEYDARIRAFYEPASSGATAAHASPARPTSAARKHRYSHVLDWNDDVTAIVNIDKHDGGARAGVPVAALAASGADRRGRASRALAAALHGALTGSSQMQPSPVPPGPPASRLAERLLRGVHGPLPTPPQTASPAGTSPTPPPEASTNYITSAADLSPRAVWDAPPDPDGLTIVRSASGRSIGWAAAASVAGGEQSSAIPTGSANFNVLSSSARLLYYGSAKPRQAQATGTRSRPASAQLATQRGTMSPHGVPMQPGRRPASALSVSTISLHNSRPPSASAAARSASAAHALITRRRPASASPALGSGDAASAGDAAGGVGHRPDPADGDAAPAPASPSLSHSAAASAAASVAGASGVAAAARATGARRLAVVQPEPPASVGRRPAGPSNGVFVRDPVGPQLSAPRRAWNQHVLASSVAATPSPPTAAPVAAADGVAGAAAAAAAVATASPPLLSQRSLAKGSGGAGAGIGIGIGGGGDTPPQRAGGAAVSPKSSTGAASPADVEGASAATARVRHGALAAARRALWEHIAGSASAQPRELLLPLADSGIGEIGAFGDGGLGGEDSAGAALSGSNGDSYGVGATGGAAQAPAAAAAAALGHHHSGLLQPFASVAAAALQGESSEWLPSLRSQPPAPRPLRSVRSADTSHTLQAQHAAHAPPQAAAGAAAGAAPAPAPAPAPHGVAWTGSGEFPTAPPTRGCSVGLGTVLRVSAPGTRLRGGARFSLIGHGLTSATGGDPSGGDAHTPGQGPGADAPVGGGDAGDAGQGAAQGGAHKKVQWGANVHSPRRPQLPAAAGAPGPRAAAPGAAASAPGAQRHLLSGRQGTGTEEETPDGAPEAAQAAAAGTVLEGADGAAGAAGGKPGGDRGAASGAGDGADDAYGAEQRRHLPTDSEYYHLVARVEGKPDMQGWLFNVYVTDIAPGSHVARRCCVGSCTPTDEHGQLLVPQPPRPPSATLATSGAPPSLAAADSSAAGPSDADSSPPPQLPQPPHPQSPSRSPERRRVSTRSQAAAVALGPVISPADLLPWVSRPEQLQGHWLRLEAFAIAPVAEKVLDLLTFMGDPEAEPPPERQQPRLSRLQVVETRGSAAAAGGGGGGGGGGGVRGSGEIGSIAAAALLGLRPAGKAALKAVRLG